MAENTNQNEEKDIDEIIADNFFIAVDALKQITDNPRDDDNAE